ncbi:retrovirus-related pol polyprotein from transposon TNT 1-94 [Tanacetum coccineum]
MTTLVDKSLLSCGDNKPPMLEKHLYDSWKSIMELYMMNRPHGRMILASVEKGPLVWPTIIVDGVTRPKEYTELTPAETIQADYDIKGINIILQGLPTEIYALVSQHRVSKDIWEKIKLTPPSSHRLRREMNLEDELQYTKSYIPTISDENYIPDILKPIIRNLRNYGEKSHKSIIDPWRNTHSLPYSPPLSPNNSLPKSPPTSPIFDTTPLPPSPNSSNPTFSSLPPQTPTPNHSENRLHELLHLSNLLDITIQNAIEFTNRLPPFSSFTHPPCLDQVNFHSDFCHCCLGTRKIFNILKDDLNRIKSLIIRPSTLFLSSITTNSP